MAIRPKLEPTVYTHEFRTRSRSSSPTSARARSKARGRWIGGVARRRFRRAAQAGRHRLGSPEERRAGQATPSRPRRLAGAGARARRGCRASSPSSRAWASASACSRSCFLADLAVRRAQPGPAAQAHRRSSTCPPWTDGVIRHSVFMLGFLGGAYATYTGRHIRIDAVTRVLTARKRMLLRVLTTLAALGIVAIFTGRGYGLLPDHARGGGRGVAGEAALHPARGALIIVIGYIVIAFHFFVQVVIDVGWLVSKARAAGASGSPRRPAARLRRAEVTPPVEGERHEPPLSLIIGLAVLGLPLFCVLGAWPGRPDTSDTPLSGALADVYALAGAEAVVAVDDPAVHLRRLPDGRAPRPPSGWSAWPKALARLDPRRAGAHDAVDLRVLHHLHRRLGRDHRRARRRCSCPSSSGRATPSASRSRW